jgi:hypothetical protein
MVRIQLIANCLADPSGIKFKGYEVDVTEEKAAPLLATGQWKRVAPPAPEPTEPEAPESGEWTGEPVTKPKREYRGKR